MLPFEDRLLSPLDYELLVGASYGSDVTVSEVIVTASRGGGNDIVLDYDYYQQNIERDREYPQFQAWSEDFRAEVEAFADAHVTGDESTDAYKQAHEAISALYALAKIKSVDPHETGWFYANNHTFTWTEILSSLQSLDVTISPHNHDAPAYTDTAGSINHVFIDPTRVSTYSTPWFSSAAEGLNYVIYHELAHAFQDGESDRMNPNLTTAQREARANQYGQVLAAINAVEYPSDSELVPFGGS